MKKLIVSTLVLFSLVGVSTAFASCVSHSHPVSHGGHGALGTGLQTSPGWFPGCAITNKC